MAYIDKKYGECNLIKEFASKINSFLKIEKRGPTITKEVLGSLAIFLAMVYVLSVNAVMLSYAGMNFGAVFAATALAAIVGIALNFILPRNKKLETEIK
jgi:AGZA family xanthine/uracil permease-like MFS transporter